MTTTTRIAIFARSPMAGATKTRLAPAIGAEGAALLHRAFLGDLLTRAQSLPRVSVELWLAGDVDRAWEATLRRGFGSLTIHRQGAGDLGERIVEACVADGDRSTLVVGSDAPTLPEAYLLDALRALRNHDTVLGPTADGGYYLVGVRQGWARRSPRDDDAVPAAQGDPVGWERLFRSLSQVRWSTARALVDTAAGFVRERLSCAFLPPWYDVDTPADLALLAAHLAIRPEAAPDTAKVLTEVLKTKGF
ncbi:MAG: glycosyltransferase [Myxococcales bacterium]|nr:glycosyltransferase [Myxococcales bacterium]